MFISLTSILTSILLEYDGILYGIVMTVIFVTANHGIVVT